MEQKNKQITALGDTKSDGQFKSLARPQIGDAVAKTEALLRAEAENKMERGRMICECGQRGCDVGPFTLDGAWR